MKQIIILFVLLSVSFAGHIYVGDVSLKYQNAGYFQGFKLAVNFESGLSKNDLIIITWPFALSDFTSGQLTKADGTIIKLSATGTANTVYINLSPASNVDANTWFELSVVVTGSTTAQLYAKPIAISTQSNDGADAIIYDENQSAGMISIVAPPQTLTEVFVTTDATQQADVSSSDSCKALGGSCPVYIDFKPVGDYTKGAIVYYSLGNLHTFGTGCTVLDNTCNSGGSCRNATKAGGSCAVDSTNNQMVKASFNSLRSTDTPITYYRISVTVQNPIYFAGGDTLTISVESKNVFRKYEVYTGSPNFFTLSALALSDKKFTLFWGLVPDVSNAVKDIGWGCPIAIYKSATGGTMTTWNKITVYFSVVSAFPTTSSNAVYKLLMKIGLLTKASVAWPSIASNLPTYPSGARLSCKTSGTNQIACDNVGGSLSVQNYWVAFSISYVQTITKDDITGLGAVQLLQSKLITTNGVTSSGNNDYQITTSTNGNTIDTNQIYESDEFIDGYGTAATFDNVGQTQVVDLQETLSTSILDTEYKTKITNVVTAPSTASNYARSGIKMPTANGPLDLIFLIAPTTAQLCSGGTALTLSKNTLIQNTSNTGTINNYCGVSTTVSPEAYFTQSVFHIIANPNIFTMTTAAQMAGIWIAPSQGFLSDGAWCTSERCGKYNSTNNTYELQKTAKAFNFWQKTTQTDIGPTQVANNYWLLILTCASDTKVAVSGVCSKSSSAIPTSTFNWPSVGMPGATLSSSFKGNSLYPSVNELDFIVCFRANVMGPGNQATQDALSSNTSLGALSSTGVLHALVYQGGLNTSTQFRISFVNEIKNSNATTDSINSMKIAPILLRVSGIVASSDLNNATVSNIAIFFDHSLTFKELTDSTHVLSNPGSVTSGSFSYYMVTSPELTSGATAGVAAFNYYPVMQRFVLSTGITADQDFNYYTAVQFTEWKSLKALNLMLAGVTNNSNLVSGPVYNLYGLRWQLDTQIYFDTTNLVYSDTANDTTGAAAALNSPGTEYLGGCTGGSQIFTNNAQTLVYGGLVMNASIVKISNAGCIAAGRNSRASTISADSERAKGDKKGWGSHFIIAQTGTQKYWSGNFTNGFKNTKAPIFDCAEMNYKLSSQSDTRSRFILICPLDSADSSPSISDANLGITFAKFTVPIYFGSSGDAPTTDQLSTLLGYIYTLNNGIPKFYIPQKGTIATMTPTLLTPSLGCTVTANTAVMNYAGNAQKVTFAFNPKQSFNLQYSATSGKSDAFKVKQTITQWGSQSVIEHCVGPTGLDCILSASSGQQTFTLTGSSLSPTSVIQSIQASEMSINFWMSDTTTTSPLPANQTHTAQISLYNPDINSGGFQVFSNCDLTSNNNPAWAITGNYSNKLTILTDPIISNKLKSARTTFSLSWSVSKPVWSFSYFEVTIGNLTTSSSNVNKRCRVYNQDGSLSFDFDTISNDLTGSINIEPNDLPATSAYTYTKTQFTLKCNGITTSSSINSADFFVNHKSSSTETIVSGNRTNVSLQLLDVTAPSNVVLAVSLAQKKTNDAGLLTSYVFNIKNTGTASLQSGYYIIVEFSTQVTPRLNRKGQLYCEQGYNSTISQAYCSIDNDRRVRLFASQAIDNNTQGYNFTIYGIENAGVSDSLKKIYFHIEQEDGTVIFKPADDLNDETLAASVVTDIPVLDFTVSGNVTRSTSNFMIDLSLLSTQIGANAEVWVQFDSDYISTFYKSFSPSCSLQRILTPPGQTDFQLESTNFAANCTFMQPTYIKIFLNANDTKNTVSSMYRLSINGVPTPWNPTSILYQLSAPSVILAQTALTGVITSAARTASMNNTMYGVGNSAGIQLDWASLPVTAPIGVYMSTAKATLQPISDKFKLPMTQFSADTTFTVSSTAFSFAPTTFSVKQGDSALSFVIAPKATTSPGLYYLTFSVSSANSGDYAPLKPLSLLAKTNKCTLDVLKSFNFPATTSGTSLPYVVDFLACQPESMVTLKIAAQITNGTSISSDGVLFNGQGTAYSNQNTSYASPNFTFADGSSLLSQTVTYGSNTGFTFQLKNLNVVLNAGETTRLAGRLLFAWDNSSSSVNYKSYSNILSESQGFAEVNAIASDSWASMIKSNSDVVLVPASATYSISCDQPAIVYYIASRSNDTVTSAAASDIKANTLSKNILSTYPVGKDATIQGYKPAYSQNIPVSISLSPVRSNAQYFFKAICVNTAGTTADNSTFTGNFNATDNKGKPGIAKLTYSTTLTATQVTSSCAVLSSFVQVPCNRTMCSDGKDSCGNKFDPYGDFGATTSSSSSSSSSSSTNTGTSNTTSSNTTTSTNTTTTNTTTNTTHRRRVLQSTCNVTNCVTCVSGNAAQCLTCNQTLNLLKSPDNSSCVAACSNGYQNVSWQCTKIEQTIQVISVSPNLFAATDSTATKVQSAVTTNKASLLAALSTATGVASSSIVSDYVDTSSFGGVSVNVSGSVNATTQTSVTVQFNMTSVSGFVIAGYASSGATVTSFSNLKLGTTSNGTLSGMFVKYAAFGTPIQNTWSGLTQGTQYAYIYGATDLDLVNGQTSSVNSGTFTTQGTTPVTPSKGAMKITTTFFALLALLFVTFILI